MLRGSRPFIRVVVQLCKIVMRGRIPRGNVQHAEQSFFRNVELPGLPLHQAQIHERIEISGVEPHGRLELSRRLVNLSKHEQRDAVVIPGAGVARFYHHGTLQFARGFPEQISFLIKQAEIVMGLCIQLVAREQRAIVLQRVLEVAGTMIVEGEFQIVFSSRRRRGRVRRRRRGTLDKLGTP